MALNPRLSARLTNVAETSLFLKTYNGYEKKIRDHIIPKGILSGARSLDLIHITDKSESHYNWRQPPRSCNWMRRIAPGHEK
jgi:hypothetical protein